jgi:hypothetical protein
MLKLRINKGDWSGKEIDITINERTKSFKLNGYTFTLKESFETSRVTDLKSYDIMSSGWNAPIGQVWKWDDEKTWAAGDWSIQRDHENMYIAAAQYLCNVI